MTMYTCGRCGNSGSVPDFYRTHTCTNNPNTSTRVWANGYGNWCVEFPTTGLDITDHEYAMTRIHAELVERELCAADYVPTVGFISSYRGRVEFTEIDLDTRTTPVIVG
jgi:hypothetical protein